MEAERFWPNDGSEPDANACPCCGDSPFDQFLPLQVARSPWPWWAWLLPLERWRRPVFAIICRGCKAIVGYE